MSRSRDTSKAIADIVANTLAISGLDSSKPDYTYSSSAPSSPSVGDLWMDTSGASPKGMVWTGSEWKSFSGAGAAAFDEGASTGATFYTLNDPDGDGKNYRCAEFLSSGTLVMSEGGFFDTWLGGPGGRGGYTGVGGNLGHGGGCGGVLELHQLFGGAGSYTVTVGTQTGTAAGIGTSIEGPLPAPLTKITASAGGAQAGDVTTPGATGSLATTYTSYAGGTAGGGYGRGAAGTGGDANGRFGGPAATYSGWAQADFQFGAGGTSQYGPTSGAANSGDGGDGSEYSSYGTGGSGRVYVRVEV